MESTWLGCFVSLLPTSCASGLGCLEEFLPSCLLSVLANGLSAPSNMVCMHARDQTPFLHYCLLTFRIVGIELWESSLPGGIYFALLGISIELLCHSLSFLAVTAVGHTCVSAATFVTFVPSLLETPAESALLSPLFILSVSAACLTVLTTLPIVGLWPVIRLPLSSDHFINHLVIIFLGNMPWFVPVYLVAYLVRTPDDGQLAGLSLPCPADHSSSGLPSCFLTSTPIF